MEWQRNEEDIWILELLSIQLMVTPDGTNVGYVASIDTGRGVTEIDDVFTREDDARQAAVKEAREMLRGDLDALNAQG